MPMPPYPPAQVTRTITYLLSKGFLESDGVPSGSAFWNNGFQLYTLPNPAPVINGEGAVVYKMYLYENGSGTPTDPIDEADVPDLASATWQWSAAIYNNLDPTGPYFLADGAPTVDVEIVGHSDSQTAVHDPGDPPGFYRPQGLGRIIDIDGFTGFDWKFAIGIFTGGGSGTQHCANPPRVGEAGLKFIGLQISGTATWLAWWWRLPERDACGNRNPKAPTIYTRTDPSEETGYGWEKYDPNDQTAHPTPVVESVEPNHGDIAGGTTVTIKGSGFGTEATVTFDGVPGTDVDVVDETTITVVSPSHLAGSVAVVVTNFDGVSS
jgi:hypothetical protein